MLVDVFISYQLKNSNNFQGEIEVWNAIFEGNIDTDIAIYGSSRAWTQLNPAIFKTVLGKKVYNFGLDGHNFWLQYLRHRLYLKHNPKPKTIILNLDIFTLQKREDLYNLEQFLPFMFWDDDIKTFTSSYNGFSNADYYLPFARYSGKTSVLKEVFANMNQSEKTSFRIDGFRSFDYAWGFKNTEELKEYHIAIHDESITLLNKFLKECKRLEIQVILLYTPEELEGQRKIVNRKRLVQLYDSISSANNIPFLNYSKDSIQDSKAYFYNAMHLNTKGTNIISEKIAEELKHLVE